MVKHIKGGVTAPKGFLASGIHAGIKKASLLDMALIVSVVNGPIAGLFTTNRLPAAPVILDRIKLKKKAGRAIIVNSGNANAFNGPQGLLDAREMTKLVASGLQVPNHLIFVGSTGVISPPLPMPAIRSGIPKLLQRLRRSGHREAAKAIMTTDTKVKEIAYQTRIDGHTVTIGGMAKGSGMIHPNMATMLAYLTTDVVIDQAVLQTALRKAVDRSFNCISVDGETSTNDTVLCLANSLARNRILLPSSTELIKFQNLLNEACHSLALQICKDGEGATKLVEILVQGAKNGSEARQVANALSTSPLVKTALFGEDPNWGRIIAVIGRAGPFVHPARIDLAFGEILVVQKGKGLGELTERQVQRVMRRKAFTITVTIGRGPGTARVWTTDLSYDYIRINADYRS